MTLYQKVWWAAILAGAAIFVMGCQSWQQNSNANTDTPQGLMGTNTNNPTEGALGNGGNKLNRNTTAGNSSGVGTGGGM